MGDELLSRVSTYVQRHDLIRNGDRVLAAVSGGADSVCLLSVLKGLQKELSFELRAVHVDHGIRKEAGRDRAFTEKLCKKLGVPCSVYLENIPEKQAGSGMSEEELGRKIRYEDFEKTRKAWEEEDCETGRTLIATAHHKNDQAETVLFRLFRGSGISGLGGIRPMRDHIIRPLLFLERKEIEAYLREQGLTFCVDATNSDCTYSRNKIRHELIPAAEEICEEAVGHIAGTAEILQETWDYLSRVGDEAKYRCETEAGVLDRERFLQEDPYLQKQILLLMIRELPTGGKDIGSDHLEKMQSLLKSENGGEQDLPGECRFYCKQGRIWFEAPGAERDDTGMADTKVLMAFCKEKGVPPELFGEDPGVYRIVNASFRRKPATPNATAFGLKGTLCVLTSEIWESIEIIRKPEENSDRYMQYFDPAGLPSGKQICIRHRMPGDHMILNEAGNKKPLKEILIEEKIPEEYRDSLWLPACGSEILWIPGIRRTRSGYLTNKSKSVIRIDLRVPEL